MPLQVSETMQTEMAAQECTILSLDVPRLLSLLESLAVADDPEVSTALRGHCK